MVAGADKIKDDSDLRCAGGTVARRSFSPHPQSAKHKIWMARRDLHKGVRAICHERCPMNVAK
jgi:hypothetical protein